MEKSRKHLVWGGLAGALAILLLILLGGVAGAYAGAAEYKAMCEHCHAGPGVEPAAWSRGMLPRPPHLTEAARQWQPAEVVWIVRHGVKYTGMPAFGEDHDDETLWNIAAFVEDLPAMTRTDYRPHGGQQLKE